MRPVDAKPQGVIGVFPAARKPRKPERVMERHPRHSCQLNCLEAFNDLLVSGPLHSSDARRRSVFID